MGHIELCLYTRLQHAGWGVWKVWKVSVGGYPGPPGKGVAEEGPPG